MYLAKIAHTHTHTHSHTEWPSTWSQPAFIIHTHTEWPSTRTSFIYLSHTHVQNCYSRTQSELSHTHTHTHTHTELPSIWSQPEFIPHPHSHTDMKYSRYKHHRPRHLSHRYTQIHTLPHTVLWNTQSDQYRAGYGGRICLRHINNK